MKNSKKTKEKGVIIIIVFLALGILLLLGTYFLSFTITESKISKSQKMATQTYYLAEAGINEVIWKLKNDWKEDFVRCLNYLEADCGDETCQNWSATLERVFPDGSRYDVTIQNSECARGEIVSTAQIPLPNEKKAQRVVKTKVLKARGAQVNTGDSPVFSGGTSENVEIKATKLKIINGNLFSNHNLDIKGESAVEVYDDPTTPDDPDTPDIIENLEGRVLAVGNIAGGERIAAYEAICTKNECTEKCALTQTSCPPPSIDMPLVDFDSPASENLNSFKSRAEAAGAVYTASEFEDLLWNVGQGGTLTLNNAVTYVTGPIELRGGRHLVVDGVLVADGTIDIGERNYWIRGGEKHYSLPYPEYPGLLIEIKSSDGRPSGLFTKAKINFGLYSSFQDINIIGVLYANDEMRLVSIPNSFNIEGGIMARKLVFTSLWQWLNITYRYDRIYEALNMSLPPPEAGEPIEFSPIVTIEHWEESY